MPQCAGGVYQQSREAAGKARVLQRRRRGGSGAGRGGLAMGGQYARGRWGKSRETGKDVRAAAERDQCLDGNQYHKNSERVAGCLVGGWRGRWWW